jgi:hypothetical protein
MFIYDARGTLAAMQSSSAKEIYPGRAPLIGRFGLKLAIC